MRKQGMCGLYTTNPAMLQGSTHWKVCFDLRRSQSVANHKNYIKNSAVIWYRNLIQKWLHFRQAFFSLGFYVFMK